jgi:hypothetical protein
MTRDPSRPSPDQEPAIDDAELGALVRAATDEWRMPPQRLDQTTWRDRVGAGRGGGGRGPVVRVAIPFLTAVAATVVVAFVAVWLTTPRSNVGKVPPSAPAATSPSSGRPSTAPSRSAAVPTGSPLPTLFMPGTPPTPSKLLVVGGPAAAVADLTTGTIVPTGLGEHSGPMAIVPHDGGWLCVCMDWGPMVGDHPDGVDVGIEVAAADGTRSNSTIRSVRGTRDPSTPVSGQPDLADARATADPDHGVIFVGWSRFDGPRGWTAGVDVVSIASELVVGQIELPLTEPSLDVPRYARSAPTVTVSPSGKTVLVTDAYYSTDGVIGMTGAQTWTGAFDGSTITGLREGGGTTGCDVASSGRIDDTSSYVLCWGPISGVSLFRFDASGHPIGVDPTKPADVDLGLDGLSQVARSGDHLYLWQPVAHTLIQFDLRTGEHRTATAATAAMPETDPLAGLGRAIGRWLAPSALAKILLEPGIVVSPDGKTVYALGIRSLAGEDNGGSLGVFAFDTESMQQTAHWQPTADFLSLAISADGRFVYALGQPQVDAAGNPTKQGASITVFDPSNGQVVAIAGQLGSQGYLFPDAVAR